MKKNIILLLLIVVFGGVCFYLGNTFDFSQNKADYYIEQGYSFKVPTNWTETDELGTTAFLNEEEDNGDNPFKSYIFFVKDDLLGRSPSQYFEYIKGNIKENSENSEVIEEKEDGQFHVIYLKTIQNEINYIVGMAFLPGVNDTYSIISLNTLESGFDATKAVFEETYRSFELR